MRFVNLIAFILLMNIAIFGIDYSQNDISNNGLFLDGQNYTLFSSQLSIEMNSKDYNTHLNVFLNYGIRINPKIKLTILMPGILWEPQNYVLGEKHYFGTYVGMTRYQFKLNDGDSIHYYSMGIINKIGLKLGDYNKLSLNVPIDFNFSSEKFQNYNKLYKYNTISSGLEFERLIDDYHSFSIFSGIRYNFTLADQLSINNRLIIFNKIRFNIRNTIFFNIGCDIDPESLNEIILIGLGVEGRI